MKNKMPQTAAWVAEIREIFCNTPEDLQSFNGLIRDGLNGKSSTFWASENGHTVGTKDQGIGVTPFGKSYNGPVAGLVSRQRK